MLFWCVLVPCWVIPVLKTLSLPCLPMCCKHCVWLLCDDYCPSVGIDLYWLVFCRLLWLKVLSGSMVTRVSMNGSEPCCVGCSTVNWMWGFWLLIWCSNSWLCSALVMTKVSSTNLSHKDGGWGQMLKAFSSNSSINRLTIRGLMGDPIAAPWTCS